MIIKSVLHRNKSFEYITSRLVSTAKPVKIYKVDYMSKRLKVREKNSSIIGDIFLHHIKRTATLQLFLQSGGVIGRILSFERCSAMTDDELAKEVIDNCY